jgi:hypothetical protein
MAVHGEAAKLQWGPRYLRIHDDIHKRSAPFVEWEAYWKKACQTSTTCHYIH